MIQKISKEAGNDNDQGVSGTLHLFNPSSTTFVKHFISSSTLYQARTLRPDIQSLPGLARLTAGIV